jgi:signal transduction histidine kinase
VAIIPQPNTNAIAIADEFYKRLEEIQRVLPPEYTAEIGYDFTTNVRKSVSEVVRASGATMVRTQLAGGLPAAAADRLMLRRVLENLVGNAADSVASVPGGEVVVATESVIRDGGAPLVRVTIADTGPGMTRAELDRAFDDFYTTKAGGTGLGLSIVRRLILDLGGALRIDTEPGNGTRATVEVPAGAAGGAAR